MGWHKWMGWMALAIFLLGSGPPAAAQTVISNLPGNDAAGAGISSNIHFGTAFTMGATSYTLTGAKLRLNQSTGSAPIVELRAHSAGPGAVLTTFTNPTFTPDSLQEYTFLPGSAVTLQANTTYWLYARGGNETLWSWSASDPGVTPTGPGATHAGNVLSINGGAGFFSTGLPTSYAILGTPVPAEDAPAVPEPGALALFLPALCAVLCLRRRSVS